MPSVLTDPKSLGVVAEGRIKCASEATLETQPYWDGLPRRRADAAAQRPGWGGLLPASLY